MIAERHTRAQNLDLAPIGNSCAAALVDRNARIVWWCFPYFDSDPVFCRESPNRNRAICAIGRIGYPLHCP